MVGDGLQHLKEVGPVLRELLQVLINHLQGALKQGVQDGRDVFSHL